MSSELQTRPLDRKGNEESLSIQDEDSIVTGFLEQAKLYIKDGKNPFLVIRDFLLNPGTDFLVKKLVLKAFIEDPEIKPYLVQPYGSADGRTVLSDAILSGNKAVSNLLFNQEWDFLSTLGVSNPPPPKDDEPVTIFINAIKPELAKSPPVRKTIEDQWKKIIGTDHEAGQVALRRILKGIMISDNEKRLLCRNLPPEFKEYLKSKSTLLTDLIMQGDYNSAKFLIDITGKNLNIPTMFSAQTLPTLPVPPTQGMVRIAWNARPSDYENNRTEELQKKLGEKQLDLDAIKNLIAEGASVGLAVEKLLDSARTDDEIVNILKMLKNLSTSLEKDYFNQFYMDREGNRKTLLYMVAYNVSIKNNIDKNIKLFEKLTTEYGVSLSNAVLIMPNNEVKTLRTLNISKLIKDKISLQAWHELCKNEKLSRPKRIETRIRKMGHILGFEKEITLRPPLAKNEEMIKSWGGGKSSYLLSSLERMIGLSEQPVSEPVSASVATAQSGSIAVRDATSNVEGFQRNYFTKILNLFLVQDKIYELDDAEKSHQIASLHVTQDIIPVRISLPKHVIQGFTYKGYYLECNRGRATDEEVENENDPVLSVYAVDNVTPEKIFNFIKEDHPNFTKLSESRKENILLGSMPHKVNFNMKPQNWGTCAVVNPKSSVIGMLYLLHLETLLQSSKNLTVIKNLETLSTRERNKPPLLGAEIAAIEALKKEAQDFAHKEYKKFTSLMRDMEIDDFVNDLKNCREDESHVYEQLISGYLQAHHGQEISKEGKPRDKTKIESELMRAKKIIDALSEKKIMMENLMKNPAFCEALAQLNDGFKKYGIDTNNRNTPEFLDKIRDNLFREIGEGKTEKRTLFLPRVIELINGYENFERNNSGISLDKNKKLLMELREVLVQEKSCWDNYWDGGKKQENQLPHYSAARTKTEQFIREQIKAFSSTPSLSTPASDSASPSRTGSIAAETPGQVTIHTEPEASRQSQAHILGQLQAMLTPSSSPPQVQDQQAGPPILTRAQMEGAGSSGQQASPEARSESRPAAVEAGQASSSTEAVKPDPSPAAGDAARASNKESPRAR